MKSSFKEYLQFHSNCNDKEIELISSLAKERRLKRNETLLAEGEISRFKIFVLKGLLKAYVLSSDGHEKIFSFLAEECWTSLDVESYHKQIPSSFSTVAIEPIELLTWTKRDFEYLLDNLESLRTFADQLGAEKVYLNKQRLMTAMLGSPEEKYEKFKKDHPELLPRVPLHLIAAYLGISYRTLSRIRQIQLITK